MAPSSSNASGSGTKLFSSGVRVWSEIKGALRSIGHGQSRDRGNPSSPDASPNDSDALMGNKGKLAAMQSAWCVTLMRMEACMCVSVRTYYHGPGCADWPIDDAMQGHVAPEPQQQQQQQ
jgi:hypothetical protein